MTDHYKEAVACLDLASDREIDNPFKPYYVAVAAVHAQLAFVQFARADLRHTLEKAIKPNGPGDDWRVS